MPAVLDTLRFPTSPPTRERLIELVDEVQGLDISRTELIASYRQVDPQTIEFTTVGEHVERAYVLETLRARGGARIDRTTGEALEFRLPDYVQTPWREQPRWRRGALALRRRMERGPARVVMLPAYIAVEVGFYLAYAPVLLAREAASRLRK